MAYRNGTYIAFHAGGTTDPTASDIKYYRMLKAWHENDGVEFKFIDSHEKTAAVRDSSLRETLRRRLMERMNNSCNFMLIVTQTTRNDRDWVPFEIGYAVDSCGLPVIAAYPGYEKIMAPAELRQLWPTALAQRIDSKDARVIHIPFKRAFIDDAIGQFTVNNLPKEPLAYYSAEAHQNLGRA